MSTYWGYARVSTIGQSDSSIDIQLAYLKAKAEELDLPFEPRFEKQSGSKIEGRVVLQEIIRKAKLNDYIGFYDNSRLGRNTVEILNLFEDFKTKGLKIQISGKTIDSNTPRDLLMFELESALSSFYLLDQKLKSKLGIEEKKKSGKWIFTSRMLGYNISKVNGLPVVSINEDEAKIIRFIFRNYADGKSINKISKELTAKGFRSKDGCEFTNATVRRFIHKPIYKGYYKIDGGGKGVGQENMPLLESELVKSLYYKPIVSEELWDKVQHSYRYIKRKHSKQYPYRGAQYELSSILKCYYCKKLGKPTSYVHHFQKAPTTRKVNSNYIDRLHLAGCQQTKQTFRAEVYETLFRICYYLLFSKEDELNSFLTQQQQELDSNVEEIQADVLRIDQKISEIEKSEKNIFNAIEKYGVNDDYMVKRLNELKKEKNSLIQEKVTRSYALNQNEVDYLKMREQYSEKSLVVFIHAKIPSLRRKHYIEMLEFAYVYKEKLIIKYRNSKVFIIPLIKNRGRLIQRTFEIKVGYKGKEQYTIFADTDNETFSLISVKSHLLPEAKGKEKMLKASQKRVELQLQELHQRIKFYKDKLLIIPDENNSLE